MNTSEDEIQPILDDIKQQCKKCSAYFERFSCGMKTIGECDCPKCQGYCECKHGIIPRHRNQQ